MANNLQEKKLVNGFKSYSKLPYPKVGNIDFSEANNFINCDNLNNAYTQLIDNDLFVAQQLKNKLSYHVGPLSSTTSSSKEVQEGPDGTKFFNSEVQDGAAIFRKIDFPMQKSIKRISSTTLNDVRFIQKIDEKCILACTSSKTFYADPSTINSDNFNFSTEVKTAEQKTVKVTAVGNFRNSVFIFGCTVDGKHGIYTVVQEVDASGKTNYAFQKQLDAASEVVAIAYRDVDFKLLFATSNTLYSATYQDGHVASTSVKALLSLDTRGIGTLKSVFFLDHTQENVDLDNSIEVVTSSGTLLVSSKGIVLEDATVKKLQASTSREVNDWKKLSDGTELFATNSGLYYRNSSKEFTLVSGTSGVVKQLAVYGDEVWFGDSNKKLWKAVSSGSSCTASEYHTFSSAVVGVQFFNDMMLVATSSSLFYELNQGQKDFTEITNGSAHLQCTSMKFQQVDSSSGCIYVAGASSSFCAVIIHDPVYSETDEVLSQLSTVIQVNASTGSIQKAYPVDYYKKQQLTSQNAYAIVNYSDAASNLSSDVVDLLTKRKVITTNGAHYNGMLVDYVYPTNADKDISSQVYLFGNTYCDWLSSFNGNNSDVLDRQDLDANLIGWKVNGGAKVGDSLFAINMTKGTSSKLAYVNFDHRYTRKVLQLSETTAVEGDVFKIGNVIYTVVSKTGNAYNFGAFEPQVTLKETAIDSSDAQLTAVYSSGTLNSVVDNGELDEIKKIYFKGEEYTQHHYTRADYVIKDSTAYSLSTYLSAGPFIRKDETTGEEEVHDEGLVRVDSKLVNCSGGVKDVKFGDSPNQYAAVLVPSSNTGLSVVMKRTSDADNQCFNKAKLKDPTCLFNLQGTYARCTHGSAVNSAVIENIANDDKSDVSYALPTARMKIVNQMKTIYSTGSAVVRAIDNLETTLTATTDGTQATGPWVLQSNSIASVSETQIGSNIANATDFVKVGSYVFFRVANQLYRVNGNSAQSAIAISGVGNVQKMLAKTTDDGIQQLAVITTTAQLTYLVNSASGQINLIDQRKFSIGSSTISTGFTIYVNADSGYRERYTVAILHSTDVGSSQEIYRVGTKMMICEDGTVLDPASTNAMSGFHPTTFRVCSNDAWMSFGGNKLTIKRGNGTQQIDLDVGRQIADFWPLRSSNDVFSAMYKTSDGKWYKITKTASATKSTLITSASASAIQAIRSSDEKRPFIVDSRTTIGIPKYRIQKDVATEMKYSSTSRPGKSVNSIVLVDSSKDALLMCQETAGSIRAYQFFYAANAVDPTEISHSQIRYPNGVANSESLNCAVVVQSNGDSKPSVGIMVGEEVVWLDKNDPSLANIDKTTKFTHLANDGLKYMLFFTTGSANFQLSFTGIDLTGSSFQETSWSLQDAFTRFGNVTKIAGNNFLIAVDNALYNYTFERTSTDLMDWGYRVKQSSRIGALTSFTDSIQTTFLVADGESILSSANARTWESQLSVGSASAGLILAYTQLGSRNVIAGKSGSSDSGVYWSKYTYDTVNDTPVFTADDAYSIYQEKLSEIDLSIQTACTKHIEDMHGDGSSAKLLTEYTSRNFEINGFIQEPYSKTSVKNDYIERILTGDADSEIIYAKVSNTALGNKKQAFVDCSYIAKCWKSGIIELFIYIPTTRTYYIPHIKYAGFCSAQENVPVDVNNRMLKANIKDNYTTIEVGILSSYFFIDNIFENTIKGNSLPLKIYRDNTNYENEEGVASHLFHSFIEPSVASDVNLAKADYEFYHTEYYCFGSDAQAIKITGYDSQKNYLKKYKTVIYHGMGGTSIIDGSTIVTQRILEDAASKPLYDTIFDCTDAIFLGWTTNKSNDSYPDYFGPTGDSTIRYDQLEQSNLHLYAIWNRYQFSSDDTTIELNAAANEKYTIAEMTIDPNMTFSKNQPLGTNVVIDFDATK